MDDVLDYGLTIYASQGYLEDYEYIQWDSNYRALQLHG